MLSFPEIARAIRGLEAKAYDLVVGIGSGGAVPAALAAFHLRLPLHMIWYNYRDRNNQPRYPEPRLQRGTNLPDGIRHILLVDDVSVTGRTLNAARRHLDPAAVTTMVLKGTADIVLFPDISSCVAWPWKQSAHITV